MLNQSCHKTTQGNPRSMNAVYLAGGPVPAADHFGAKGRTSRQLSVAKRGGAGYEDGSPGALPSGRGATPP